LFGRYADFIARQTNEVPEIKKRAVEDIFKGSFYVCARVWNTILEYWNLFGETEKERWRKAAESLACSLILLSSEDEGFPLYLWGFHLISMAFELSTNSLTPPS
jgi:hypothetical protein